MKVDAHQHFWQFDPVRDAWIDNSMELIRRDFMPEELYAILQTNNIDGCVAVQADQSEKETFFLLELAKKHSFIKGVVGWVDLLANDLKDQLSELSTNSLLKGVRHIAQGEADDYLTRPDVQKGIQQLADFDMTYDILVYAHQLPAAINLVHNLPDQAFVLDHIAKPQVSKGMEESWRRNIFSLAQNPKVYCKISGMVTETTDYSWRENEFTPFLDFVFEAFGVDRIMYGSDWPVCLLAAEYAEQLGIVKSYISTLSDTEQEKVMGGNASRFYKLNIIDRNT
jgi:L-fuconolactonase